METEWKALAPGLASVDDADRIRGKILTAFESADRPVVLVRLTEKGLNVYRRLTRRILALHREQWSALSGAACGEGREAHAIPRSGRLKSLSPGFTIVLAGLKALLEHGIDLVRDQFPDAASG